MRLILHTSSPSKLRKVLQLIQLVRKQVVFRFNPHTLTLISHDPRASSLQPQVWAKINLKAVFAMSEVKSLRNNNVEFEVSSDQVIQILKTFEADVAEILVMKLLMDKRRVGVEQKSMPCLSFTYCLASLAGNGDVTRTFKVPVKVFSSSNPVTQMVEPPISHYSLIAALDPQFAVTYKRLDKFKKIGDHLVISVNSGLSFHIESEGRYAVTLSYKHDLRKVSVGDHADSLRQAVVEGETLIGQGRAHVRLNDWLGTKKVVSTCRANYLMFADHQCVVHSWLDDDSDDIEIKYYLCGYRLVDD